ncbi:MAG: PBP1b-binding outer membrane lipoprotein LpoB [Candidatus Woesearchaeota archaeon]|jgi:PBP1b-binding outer membrane lipoprotein LpoB
MKKRIVLTFILLVGLLVLSGCVSTIEDPSTNQQPDPQEIETEQNQQQSGLENLPRPPALPED